MSWPFLQNRSQLCGAISYQRKDRRQKQDQANSPRESRGNNLAAVPLVEFRSSRKFRLILGFDSIFAVPPRAAAVEVGSNFRGADRSHLQSIAQIFYAVIAASLR